MGSGRWSEKDWTKYATASVVGKTTEKIYTKSSIDSDFDPKLIKIRESCDSDSNPQSTALIVAEDVTGSMSPVLDATIRGLSTLVTEIYNRKPITDPHMLFMGVGDFEHDRAPLQVTQFEADIRIAEQLAKIYLEQGGGGNTYESYAAAWYFAATRTAIDCFTKRGKKGYLFTVGDECPTPYLLAGNIEQFLGDKIQGDHIGVNELLTMVSRQYEVFHIMIEEGNYMRRNADKVVKSWTELLGQRAIRLSDVTKLPETIVSILQLNEGTTLDTIVSSWDKSTSLVIQNAVKDMTKGVEDRSVVRF
jgi:hypothetical protein